MIRQTPLLAGIDIGGTNLKALLVDGELDVVKREAVRTPREATPSDLIATVKATISRLLEGRPLSDLAGVGVGIPGLVDTDLGLVNQPAVFPEWSAVPLRDMLTEELGLPVYVDHDLRAITYGEMYKGAARGHRDFVCAAIGTGIGISIVINGDVYTRSTGDWGHMTVDYNGGSCRCGGQGCLESIASGRAIARSARLRALDEGSMLAAMSDGDLDRLEAKHVFAAARLGDRLSCEIVSEAAEAIGAGVANLFALLNPEVVVIGGGVAESGDILFSQVRQSVARRSWICRNPGELIIPGQLGPDAGCIGAALRVTQSMANDWKSKDTTLQRYALGPSF